MSKRILVSLHLLPGLLTLIAFFPLAIFIPRWGLPNQLTVQLSVLLGSFPFQALYLLFRKKGKADRTWMDVITFTEPIPWREFVLFVVLSIGWMAFVLLVVGLPIKAALIDVVFSWVPPELFLDHNHGSYGQFSRPELVMMVLIHILFIGILAPVLEELYFRGHLLPHMSSFGGTAPFINTGLFALYHLATPWDIPMIFLAYLVPVTLVWKKENVFLGVVVHVLTNLSSGVWIISVIL